MKKAIFVAIGALILSFITAGVALAGSNPHNGTDVLDDICAGCHRAHTAAGPRLQVKANNYDLCITCHMDGTGSKLDVVNGQLLSADSGGTLVAETPRLNAGGFANVGNGGTATSSHDATGTIGGQTQVWGYNTRTGTSQPMSYLGTGLTCSSCHDVHGTTMYRLLKYNVGDSVGADSVSVAPGDTYDDNPSYSYQDFTNKYYYGVSGGKVGSVSQFCAACHKSYLALAQGSGSTSVAGTWDTYRHRIDMPWNGDGLPDTLYGTINPSANTVPGSEKIPLATDGGGTPNQVMMCLTCHYAHGTSAGGGIYSGNTPPGGNNPAGDTSLLRLSGRGVCQTCHQRPQ